MKRFEDYLAGEAQLAEERTREHYRWHLEKRERETERDQNLCLFASIAALLLSAVMLGMSF